MGPLLLLLGVVLAAILSSAMTWTLRPLLSRYALARPNARSSHKTPTPQGGGLAVVSATLIVASLIMTLSQSNGLGFPASIFGATLFIAAVGAADDLEPIPVLPRLVLQTLAVGTVFLPRLPTCTSPRPTRSGWSAVFFWSRGFGSSIWSISWTG